ncbi:MAG: hypothetical protein HY055_07770, partial [Magnetospirillum sp.]|nr:hypothetical protein [Magnetospirillum sp.]
PHGDSGETRALEICFGEDLIISPDNLYIVECRYAFELTGNGADLMFSGAIQPSDYSNLGRFFDVQSATKLVSFTIRSEREHRIHVHDGSRPDFFPEALVNTARPPHLSSHDGLYLPTIRKVDLSFEEVVSNDSRARYFMVHATPLVTRAG